MTQVRCVHHDRAQLGEGVFWSVREERLYWIDIDGGRVCRFNPETGENQSVKLGQKVGAVVENASGGLVAGLGDGVYGLDFAAGSVSKWCDPMGGDAGNRLNDGKAGPDGRLYIGGMGPEGKQSLYRIEHDGRSFAEIERGITCSNGMAWSADRTTFFYIDSPQRVVWAYDFEMATGEITNQRVVVEVTDGEAVPDGMTIDAKGMLWVAFWNGWSVRRYDPSSGKLLAEVKLPVARVTSCAFGGVDLDTLYITTASVGFSEADWEREPQAGGLFAVDPGVKGVPSFCFGKA